MDFAFLPFKAVMLLLFLCCCAAGAFYWRKSSKLLGAAAGGTIGVLVVSLIAFMSPVKLTTNTKTYNATQTQKAAERHSKLPDRVVVEVKTFEQLQAEEAARSIEANKQLKGDLNETH